MCIAILNAPHVEFPREVIDNSWDSNPQGAGLIWVENGKVEIFKTLISPEILYDKYVEVRRNNPDSYIVLHFRISTAGLVDENNCHPFYVNDNLAFVHNGIFSSFTDRTSPYSDTWHFNEKLLKKLPEGFLYNEKIRRMLTDVSDYSKLIFLNNKNEPFVIKSANAGQVDNDYPGCWFSNGGYKSYSRFLDVGGKQVERGGWQKKEETEEKPKLSEKDKTLNTLTMLDTMVNYYGEPLIISVYGEQRRIARLSCTAGASVIWVKYFTENSSIEATSILSDYMEEEIRKVFWKKYDFGKKREFKVGDYAMYLSRYGNAEHGYVRDVNLKEITIEGYDKPFDDGLSIKLNQYANDEVVLTDDGEICKIESFDPETFLYTAVNMNGEPVILGHEDIVKSVVSETESV